MTPFLLLVFGLFAIWLIAISSRIKSLEVWSKDQSKPDDGMKSLLRRIEKLEAAVRDLAKRPATTVTAPQAEPRQPSPAATHARVSAPDWVTSDELVESLDPAALLELFEKPAERDHPPEPVPGMLPPVVPVPALPVAPVTVALPPTAPIAPVERTVPMAWEVVVGTSWLNKLGVLVVVIGVALFLGYSMAHVGPGGRVAIGYAIAGSMLAGGVILERRPQFANYAYGLIAGGWAGVYFTTYAMHAVDAAHIVDSDLTATAGLALVACGMIAHSLKYRSQTVTTLAYVVAYATLLLTPLTNFSVVASMPLAISLIAISQTFGWSGVATFGLVSTYGLFAVRTPLFVANYQTPWTGGMDSAALAPYIALAGYWLAFEIADILGSRARQTEHARTTPLFVLNGVGLLGAALLQLPVGERGHASVFFAVASLAYVVSAFVRSRVLDRPSTDRDDTAVTLTTTHGAVAIAAAFAAWSIDLRFSGRRETVALLFEAELLFFVGIALGDRIVRLIGSVVAAGVTVHVLTLLTGLPTHSSWPFGMSGTTPVLLLAAAAWYANREWLRDGERVLGAFESGYTWVALALVGVVIWNEAGESYRGVASLAYAGLLFETGMRRGPEYRHQAYVAGSAGAYWMLLMFVGLPQLTSTRDCLVALPATVAMAYAIALRAALRARSETSKEFLYAAGAAGCLGTVLVAVFEWRVAPPQVVAALWAGFAMLLVAGGAWRQIAGLRWQAYALLLIAAPRAIWVLSDSLLAGFAGRISAAVVIALAYAASVIGARMALRHPDEGADAVTLEVAASGLLSIAATITLLALEVRLFPAASIAPAWAITALTLVIVGAWRATPALRWQGYVVLLLGSALALGRIGIPDSVPPRELTAAALVVLALYAASAIGRRIGTIGQSAGRSERGVAVGLSLGATVLSLFVQAAGLDPLLLGPGRAATGVIMLVVGVWRGTPDLRWQGYALLAFGAVTTMMPILDRAPSAAATVVWMSAIIGALYISSVVTPRLVRRTSTPTDLERLEGACHLTLSALATVMLTTLLFQEVQPAFTTLAWGLEGAALLAVGFPFRERVLRLSGLGVLFLCILKLFVHDVWQLEALARIVSFVILGLVLLAVSWVYTKFREKILKFL